MAPPTLPASGASFTQVAPRSASQSQRQGGTRHGSRTIVETANCPGEMRRGEGAWSFQDFKVQRVLGEGAMSTVVHCTCGHTGLPVAIKMYHKERMNSLNVRQVAREVEIHASMLHPNVAKLFAAFEDEDGIYLVQELATRGDLYAELSRHGGYMLEAHVVKNVMAPFLHALAYLHSRSILHRDIKPENILLGGGGDILVADFGLAIDTSKEKPMSRVGTLDYMPPEIAGLPRAGSPAPASPALGPAGSSNSPDSLAPLSAALRDGANYGLPVDVWCTGILAYELLVGGPPFEADTKEATYTRILKTEPFLPPHLSEAARDFIRAALRKDPSQRPTVAQLQRHPWLRGLQRPRSLHALHPAAVAAAAAAGQGSKVLAAYQEDDQGEGEDVDAKIKATAAAVTAADQAWQMPTQSGGASASVSRAVSFGSVLAGKFGAKPSKPLSLHGMKEGSDAGRKVSNRKLEHAPGSTPREASDSDLIRAEHGVACMDPVAAPSLVQMLATPAPPGAGSGGRKRGSRILATYLKKLSLGSSSNSKSGGESGPGGADGTWAKATGGKGKASRLSVASKRPPLLVQEDPQVPV